MKTLKTKKTKKNIDIQREREYFYDFLPGVREQRELSWVREVEL